jgi:hypothetical protein
MTEQVTEEQALRRVHAELLEAQGDALELERYLLRRLFFSEPATRRLTFGAGNDSRQLVEGDQQDPFAGVAVHNPTPLTLFLGFEAGGADLKQTTIPPYSWVALPRRYQNVELAVAGLDAAGPAYNVMVTRLWVPPTPGAGPAGGKVLYGTPQFTDSIVPLAANGVFNGPARAIDGYGRFIVNSFSDVAGAANGLQIQGSIDGVTGWRMILQTSPAAGVASAFAANVLAYPFVRVQYVNGVAPQTVFELVTRLAPAA